MELEERLKLLGSQYLRIPKELKELNRWVCFKKTPITISENAIIPAKAPLNALNGKQANVIDSLTWTSFNVALRGCAKFNFDGLGFVLGDGLVGIDLDNHANEETGEKLYSREQFSILTNEFIDVINSYAETSQSGDGIHIICKGVLPEKANNRVNGVGVEMYETNRYFAMTGNAVKDMPVMPRTGEIAVLWKKYLKRENNAQNGSFANSNFGIAEINGKLVIGDGIEEKHIMSEIEFADEEIKRLISASKNGYIFNKLDSGDISDYKGDHSAADLAYVSILVFWCGKHNKAQIDRIYRKSGLMREKWDRKLGSTTYGDATIEKAIASVTETYTPATKEKIASTNVIKETVNSYTNNIVALNNECESTFDENGEPIIKFKNIFKTYSLDDTGNAERFYDQFGDLFRYNVTDKIFMIWNGKSWVDDQQETIRKYANALIDVLKNEARAYDTKIEEAIKEGNDSETKKLIKIQDAMYKNAQRVSNKAGKDAMLSEFRALYEIPVLSSELDEDDFVLNTESGVVDLRTGEIKPFDKKLLLSKNTHVKVSYEEPKTWIKFLNEIFDRENKEETQELVNVFQQYLGYCLTGSTREQIMSLSLGGGSNGKSTAFEQFLHVCGDYGTVSTTDVIMQTKFGGNQMFSLSKLQGKRFCYVEETDESGKLAEASTKRLTGSSTIAAQKKFGNEFDFKPKFKLCISTNNKPNISGRDLGIWRRIFPFPFLKSFTGAQKDRLMPDKLKAESDKILGWCIQGCIKYLQSEQGLVMPKCMEKFISNYKTEMDDIQNFIESRCTLAPGYATQARELFNEYKNWARDGVHDLMSETKFGAGLMEKGFQKIRKPNGNYYIGVKLDTDNRGMVFNEDFD